MNKKETVRKKVTWKKVADVFETSDLTIFKTVKGNRELSNVNVQRIKKSIEKDGMLMVPILVTKDIEVIDGEHRVAAAKLCNSKIYFVVGDAATKTDSEHENKIATIQLLNSNQKNWGLKDYIESYSTRGVSDYVKLKQFRDKNNFLSYDVCILLLTQKTSFTRHGVLTRNAKKGTTQASNDAIFDGNFKIRDMKIADDWANRYEHLNTMVLTLKN